MGQRKKTDRGEKKQFPELGPNHGMALVITAQRLKDGKFEAYLSYPVGPLETKTPNEWQKKQSKEQS